MAPSTFSEDFLKGMEEEKTFWDPHIQKALSAIDTREHDWERYTPDEFTLKQEDVVAEPSWLEGKVKADGKLLKFKAMHQDEILLSEMPLDEKTGLWQGGLKTKDLLCPYYDEKAKELRAYVKLSDNTTEDDVVTAGNGDKMKTLERWSLSLSQMTESAQVKHRGLAWKFLTENSLASIDELAVEAQIKPSTA